jgi:hypothetical protein
MLRGTLIRRIGTLCSAVVLTLGFGLMATVAVATPAQALCINTPLQGDWHNINASTNAMTRVVVNFSCGDQVLCDQFGHCTRSPSGYTAHAWGRCHPTDCDWGVRTAPAMGGDWIRAIYNFGFKTSYVWLKTYMYYGRTYLRVYVVNDFTPADGRTDYTTDEWMLKLC